MCLVAKTLRTPAPLLPSVEVTPLPWEAIEGLLHRVQKPGRYVGGEYNAAVTPWDAADIHVCLAFPDVYDLGMSNYALAILYDILNRQPRVLAHRTYLPAPDMIAEMRQAGLPLYSLESYTPVLAYQVLAISTAYEQLYTNALELMDLARIPIHTADRTAAHDTGIRYPLVIGGGHGTFNPEPIAGFFDAFVIGEAEDIMVEVAEAVRDTRDLARSQQLATLADITGLYVPYGSGAAAPLRRVTKRLVAALPPTPIRQLVPNVELTHDRGVIEIQRGCTRGCRFCQAGTITRPVRERPVDEIVATARALTEATGYEELALLSLSSADYSEIERLGKVLQAEFAGRHISLSLPSLRIDSFSVGLAEMVAQGRRAGFTFAPEAGTESLRHRINKGISDEQILRVAEEVFSRGWRTLKLYFMIGLPDESDADVEGIASLARQVQGIGRRVGGPKVETHVGVSTFVPKPHTVFQWSPLADAETIRRRQGLLRSQLRGRGLKLSWNAYQSTLLEALLARGDRRLGGIVEAAWRNGARFDAWDEWRNDAAWDAALAAPQLAGFGTTTELLDAYLYRHRGTSEPLPWDHLVSGIERRFLVEDYARSGEASLLPDCREGCHGCGILQHFADLRTAEWRCPLPAHTLQAGRSQ